MATFNFSTMQMTVKVVYYGPGLCGKTTNLQFIYSHTTPKSRGEMVSLETKSDRTLFFDLLPLEVGTIAGFKTKIQLYTVPGQVFYNTTRKLVLKGVDGIVFVADSQRPMLPSNVESLANLQSNLAELGLSIEAVPLVLQYNKRDLKDVCSVDELDQSINSLSVPTVEAAALTGTGVFETLRAISRLTLGSLKKQLEEGPKRPARSEEVARRPTPARVVAAPGADRELATPLSKPVPPPAAPRQPAADTAAARSQPDPVPTVPPKALAEPARMEATEPKAGAVPSSDGNGVVSRDILMQLQHRDLLKTRWLTLDLRLEDDRQQLVREIRDIQLELQDPQELLHKLLQLNIRLSSDA